MNNNLLLGTLIKPFGLTGEVKVASSTSFAAKRFKVGSKFNLTKDNDIKIVTVESFREAGSVLFLKFSEFADISHVEPYIGYQLFGEKDDSILEKNQYFYCDLETCAVYDFATKQELGKVLEVVEYPAQVTLRCVQINNELEFFVPFIDAFIVEVDLKSKKIYINVIPGLIWK